MIAHPNYSSIPSPDEIHAIKRRAERERSLYIGDTLGRMIRAIASIGATRRHRNDRLPSGALNVRR